MPETTRKTVVCHQACADFRIGFSGTKFFTKRSFSDREKTGRFPCGAGVRQIGSFRPIVLKKSALQ